MSYEDELLRGVLLKLEGIQREIGSVQETLIRRMAGRTAQEEIDRAPACKDRIEIEEADEVATSDEEELGEIGLDPEEWLIERGITIKARRQESELDMAFDRLASFLGERFDHLCPFYEAVKRRVAGHPPRVLDLKDEPSPAIGDIVQFGQMLHDNAFLSQFQYTRGKRILVFDPQKEGRVINFFTGGWLERYVLATVRDRVRLHLGERTEFKILLNPQVILPDSSDFELDLLVGIPDTVLWFECKTGDWQEHVAKYGRINQRYMKLTPSAAALVLLDPLTYENKQSARALCGMRVINLPELADFLDEILMNRQEAACAS